MISLAATLAAFLLPSRSTCVSAGKLALISMLVAVFFLFTAGYHFAGGADHFIFWAEAIVRGLVLPPALAQRDVGFPLVYILGGFPFLRSFIGVTLILAAFAVLMPVLVFLSLVRASPTIAFYMGIACIISLAPYTSIKFLYHDETYLFFGILAVALLVVFLWTGRFRMLIFFTLAALGASFTRPAGNLLYPVLLGIAYLSVRGPIRYYVAAALVFALGVGVYQWHRYEIFDMRNQSYYPSGEGMQILYGVYINSGEFGVQLSPDLGPNTKRLLEDLRKELEPDVRKAAIITKRFVANDPPEFMEKYVYPYSPEELTEKISKESNDDYFWILYGSHNTDDDQFYLRVALEIVRSHPWYVVKYSMRNLWHILFDPGYAVSRYNALGYIKTGNHFIPAEQGWGYLSAESARPYGPRATREVEDFPLKRQPLAVQNIFEKVRVLWLNYFGTYVLITSMLIIIAWIGALAGTVCWAVPFTGFCRVIRSSGVDKLTAPIVAVSAFLLNEALVTSLFAHPDYRYFHYTELYRLVVAGFGAVVVTGTLSWAWRSMNPTTLGTSFIQPKRESIVSTIQEYDLLNGYFGRRPGQWVLLLVVVNAGLFAWWTASEIANAWNAPPLEIVSATYRENCLDFSPKAPAKNSIREGNVTSSVKKVCEENANRWCAIPLDKMDWEDPAPGCEKNFSVNYRCQLNESRRTVIVDALGARKSLQIDCYGPAPAPEPSSGLNIRSATYGGNCGAASGNATQDLASSCNGKIDCAYTVDVARLGDPAPRCGKDFAVSYSCAPDATIFRKSVPSEAGLGSILDLSCGPTASKPSSGLNIRSATYGGNCGAASSNATQDLMARCNGKAHCTYKVDVARLGDPARGCGKDFVASFSCAPDTTILRKDLPAEAGLGSVLDLSCEPTAPAPSSGLNIRSATYGGNCGAAQGNTTSHLASSCNGKEDCIYNVDVNLLGDPAPRCGKDFAVSYSCAPDTTILRKDLPAEAGFGGVLKLNCPSASDVSTK
jgi:hypothetical protein